MRQATGWGAADCGKGSKNVIIAYEEGERVNGKVPGLLEKAPAAEEIPPPAGQGRLKKRMGVEKALLST